MIKAHVNTLKHNQELEVLKYLASITVEHSGRVHVRQLEDLFRIKSCNSEHEFFVDTSRHKHEDFARVAQGWHLRPKCC